MGVDIVGKVFKSNNCGEMVVIRRGSYKDIDVMFKETGSVVNVKNVSHVYNGRVKDPLFPLVYGFGYHGVGKHSAFLGKRVRSKAYSRWHGILDRCYNKKCSNYNLYGGSGVTVSTEWHNFQNFAEWYFQECLNAGVDPESNTLHIDKDVGSKEDKVYSRETCRLLTLEKNNEHAHAKNWAVLSPCGEEIEIYNLSKFCRKNGLSPSSMARVCRGLQESHRGYTFSGRVNG